MTNNFTFTFETDDDLHIAERSGYIESYDIVRICRTVGEGSIDYPCKSKQRFEEDYAKFKDSILEIYPTQHSYDYMDYL